MGTDDRSPGEDDPEHALREVRNRFVAGVPAQSASIDSLPQMPHDDDVSPRRGVGAGAAPPVSTVTTLKLAFSSGSSEQ